MPACRALGKAKGCRWLGGRCIISTGSPICLGHASGRYPVEMAWLASKYRTKTVHALFFGDGAINQGRVHEALNVAGLQMRSSHCDKNCSMGTSVERSTSLKQIVDRAEGYDIPGTVIDGMNFREVRDKLSEIVSSIRADPHPAFAEVRTYRYRGHSMSDPASYRTKEQLEQYRLDDPITRLRAQLTREGKLTNEQFDRLDKEAKEIALASVKFAEESPEPPLEKLYDYTYAAGAAGVSPAKPQQSAADTAATTEGNGA